MERGKETDDLFFILNECRQLLDGMGQTVHDKRYDKFFRQVLPAEYERVRLTSYEKWGVGLNDIWHMMYAMYVDNILRPLN